jgi:predicted O-methyltransferase YrrM
MTLISMIPNPLIHEIYETRKVIDKDGQKIDVWAHISSESCVALYNTILKYRPRRCVEIGMSCGLSTLAILTALDEIGDGGHLISIDPFQSTKRKGVGIVNVKRSGLEHLHTLMEEPDYFALPRLFEQDNQFEFSYIDGWHTFDYVMIDFFYLDKMTSEGGVIGFNDCGWRAINKALKFMQTHRRYSEIDVGLKPNYRGRNVLYTLARRYLDFRWNDRYYRKEEDWEPKSNFYAKF